MHGADWLDTKTQAQLQRIPPDKLAPPDVDGYSLILLQRGADRRRVDETIEKLAESSEAVATECPFVVRRNLSLADAMLGQFELVCTDSISIFLVDDVVRFASPTYLRELYSDLRSGGEFAPVTIQLDDVPADESGRRFLRQFFGQVVGVGRTHTVAHKKARIMAHWAARFGVLIKVEEPSL